MNFYSTRDPYRSPVSFQQALLSGLAPDGGLYIPERVPRLDDAWRDARTLPELAQRVLTPWLDGELDAQTLSRVTADALDFPVPLRRLDDGLAVLELFHGPTLSFKDVGARTMARLMNAFLRGRRERLTILVATSGDTGSAVADGFAGQENIRVVLLYPRGKVSEVQERQLVAPRSGVQTYAVEGDFDACQRLVKAAFVDPELRELGLSSANSINLGRLLPQSTYYLWAAREGASRHDETPPIFCVPSGNLGNLMAGVLASKMALHVPRFIAAHNANDFFPGYLNARYEHGGFRDTVATLSNAMDVGAPSNFERLYALLGGEALRRSEIWGTSVSDEATLVRLRQVYEAYGYIACPHTAVGFEAAARYRAATGDHRPITVLATAHPAKFADSVGAALGTELPKVPALEALQGPAVEAPPLPPTLTALKRELLATA
jgi:threonine synthase